MPALLSGRYRLSRREVQQALQELWAVKLSPGAVVRQEQDQTAALAPVGATLAAHASVYSNPGETIYTLRVRNGGLEMVQRNDDRYFDTVVPAIPSQPTRQLAFSSSTVVYATDPPAGGSGTFLPGPDGRPRGLFQGGRFYRRAVQPTISPRQPERG